MDFEHIRWSTPEQGIAVVTLSRPERLNTLTSPLFDELETALDRIERDDSIRAWVLTGAPRPDGRPCFSAGVDVRAFAEGKGVGTGQGFRITNRIDDMLKPSVAVIDGVCSTGGAELALSCDLRIVGEAAEISDWHLKNLGTGLGGWGASTRWSKLVGVTKAKEIILTGKVVDGEEAVRCGFATALHASDRLMDEAIAMATRITEMDPKGVGLTLAHLDRNQDMSRDQALRWAELLPDWLGVSTDVASKSENVLGKTRKS